MTKNAHLNVQIRKEINHRYVDLVMSEGKDIKNKQLKELKYGIHY